MDYSQFKDKKILITGGLGFIGSNLAHPLVKYGAKVTIYDAQLIPYGFNSFNINEIKNDVKVVIGDVRDTEKLRPYIEEADYIFHLAGQVSRIISMENPLFDNEVNCIATLNILELMRKLNPNSKILFPGSRGEMGDPEVIPVDEKSLPLPTDIYGTSKLAAEHYMRIYHQTYGLKTVTLRINNVYGPRCQMKSPHYGIVNLFIDYVFHDKTIPVWGKGEQTRDYFFIDDLVDAFMRAALSDKANGQVYFVGSGLEIKFLDMVKTIINVMDKGEYELKEYPDIIGKIDIKRFQCDISKIKNDLGWEPKVSIEEGITRTVEYYKKHMPHYESNQKLVSVILLSYNEPEDIIECASSIINQSYANIELIIVDNNSNERTKNLLKDKLPNVRIIWNEENLGRTGGYNVGINAASGEAILMLDQDTVAQSTLVEELIKKLYSDEKIGAVGPMITFFDDPNLVWSTGTWVGMTTGRTHFINWHAKVTDETVKQPMKVQQYPTAILVKSEILKKIGSYDEDVMMVYCDSNLCLKIIKAGYELWYVPSATVLHKEPVQPTEHNVLGAGSKLRAFLIGRNRIQFMRKFAGPLNFLIFLFIFLPVYCVVYLATLIRYKQFDIARAFLKGTGYGLLYSIGLKHDVKKIIKNI